jgi:hypothetical protein
VGVVKSLWASVQGDPVFMRRVNGWLAVFWVAMIPISLYTGWVKSVVYVSALSLWALVSGHWSAWQAARVEVTQQEEAKARDEIDLPGAIVEQVIEKTDVQPAGS